MSKIITLLLAFLPAMIQAQTTPRKDTITIDDKHRKLEQVYADGTKLFSLSPVDDSARAQAQTAQSAANMAKQTAESAASVNISQNTTLNNLTATVNSLNNITTSYGSAITNLQAQVAGMSYVDAPIPKEIFGNYTLNESDNNGTLYAYATTVITCPYNLSAGFEVTIYRMGSPTVTINGALSTSQYKRISGANGWAKVKYLTNSTAVLTGTLTK